MASKTEQVLEAIKALLMAVPNAKIERNTVVQELIPAVARSTARAFSPMLNSNLFKLSNLAIS